MEVFSFFKVHFRIFLRVWCLNEMKSPNFKYEQVFFTNEAVNSISFQHFLFDFTSSLEIQRMAQEGHYVVVVISLSLFLCMGGYACVCNHPNVRVCYLTKIACVV